MYRFAYRVPSILLILMTIVSCAGIQYQDQPVSARTLDSDRSKTRATVLAQAEEWRNSGVIIEKGKGYSINAKGRWLIGAQCNWTGPDGIGAYNIICWEASPIVRGWTSSALIGKIGEKGTPFGIGAEIDLFPKETGTLHLRINDTPGLCGDNQGHVDVDIALVGTDLQQSGEIKAKDSAIQTEREYIPRKDAAYNRVQGKKWAVVIGVSNYNDSQIPSLRYAANDAQAFHDWLVSKKGGGYAPSRVKLLINTDATVRNIKNALFNWLGQALEEDTVIVFLPVMGVRNCRIIRITSFFSPMTPIMTMLPRRDSLCGILRLPLNVLSRQKRLWSLPMRAIPGVLGRHLILHVVPVEA